MRRIIQLAPFIEKRIARCIRLRTDRSKSGLIAHGRRQTVVCIAVQLAVTCPVVFAAEVDGSGYGAWLEVERVGGGRASKGKDG